MTRTRIAALALTAAAGLTFLSACGSSGSSTADTSTADTSTAAPSATSSAARGTAAGQPGEKSGAVRLTAASVGNLGTVVTDTNGMTLYRFDLDVAKPPTTNCDGDCARAWPPLLATSDTVEVSGVDKALVGTVTRKDGTRQLTVNSWPVYRFAKDKAPGDANGQGVNGTWFAVTPQGRKAVAAAAPAAADNGYGY
ncbi:MAG: hypothetical protein AUI14_22695 [Actinobacteria bacterium 13_2_20CM_2_71_6]|nr:MAG: hypothetical protein AUI14_22695 [Actinobacteria bacterium 13_2_20CM_2_71_6]